MDLHRVRRWLRALPIAVLLALAWPVVHADPGAEPADASAAAPTAASAATAATVPPGFSEFTTQSGFTLPTSFDFAPDGQLFVAEQGGRVLRYDGVDDTTPQVFADLRTEVHHFADRGLLGVLVDPQWPIRPYVYILYVYDAPVGGTAPTYGTPRPMSTTVRPARASTTVRRRCGCRDWWRPAA